MAKQDTTFASFLKGWTKSLIGKYKKEKERLLAITDEQDIKAEANVLTSVERDSLRNANERANKLRRDIKTE